jgi:hypothetical protein
MSNFMTRQENDWNRYRELREQFLNTYPRDPVSPELESLILEDPDKKRDFVSHLHLQAALAVFSVSQDGDQPGVHVQRGEDAVSKHNPMVLNNGFSSGQATVGLPRGAYWSQAVLWSASVTAVVLWFALVYFEMRSFTTVELQSPIAVMGLTENCHWGESSLPTTHGSPLFAGRIRLLSGTARLQMANTQLTLEGPVDFELISENRCKLRSGRVLMTSQDGGDGLVIIVPNGAIADFGAKIGVYVSDAGDADLHVFSGLVKAKHCALGTSLDASKSDNVRIQPDAIQKSNNNSTLIELSPPIAWNLPKGMKQDSLHSPRFARRRISTLT